MLASPMDYTPGSMRNKSKATFDDTKILDAKTGQYVLMAKRKDRNWYIGAMTNWTPRELTLSFSFLPSRTTYKADVYTDTPVSDLDAERYEHKVISVNQQTKLDIRLASGGGAAVYLYF